jgi:hypothetical protein
MRSPDEPVSTCTLLIVAQLDVLPGVHTVTET